MIHAATQPNPSIITSPILHHTQGILQKVKMPLSVLLKAAGSILSFKQQDFPRHNTYTTHVSPIPQAGRLS